jgi:DNA-binding PadR family transcriptional regulator
MKTADLIPFILIELNEKDKYGFELTKSIESKSLVLLLVLQL